MFFNKIQVRNHHDHGCGCGHTHEEEHNHAHGCGCGDAHEEEHNHAHGCGCGDHSHEDKSKDEKTLNILLVHWVNHNESHEEGFKEWAEKAKSMGKEETSEYIEKAIKCIQEANEMLIEAKKHM